MRNTELVVAIVAGSVIISAGLYFGLQGRGAPEPSPPSSSPPTATGTVAAFSAGSSVTPPPVPGMPPAALPGASPELSARVQKAVAAAIEDERRTNLKKCWESARTEGGPPKVKLTWNGTIGTDGKPAAYGISEHRDAFQPGVSECASKALQGIILSEPPPQPVPASVEFELP